MKTGTVSTGPRGHKVTFTTGRCESVTALTDYAKGSTDNEHPCTEETYAFARSGDLSRVAASDAFLGRLEAALPIAYTARETVRGVCGGVADVPAYLAGSPMNMRRRVPRGTPAPITIVSDIGTSAATGADIIARRGAATLALLRRLEMAGHPVTVWAGYACAHAGTQHVAIVARLDSAPIDLARAAWVLGSPEYQRQVSFRAGHRLAGYPSGGGYIGWPKLKDWYGAVTASPDMVAVYRGALGLGDDENLIVMPPATLAAHECFVSDASTLQWLEGAYAAAIAAAGMAEAA